MADQRTRAKRHTRHQRPQEEVPAGNRPDINGYSAGYTTAYGGGFGNYTATGGAGGYPMVPGYDVVPGYTGSHTWGGGDFGNTWAPIGPHTGKGPRNYRRRDQRIEEDIHERLTADGHIDARDIKVAVRDGHVTLMGTVANHAMHDRAKDIAESVAGVDDVYNGTNVQQTDDRGAWYGW